MNYKKIFFDKMNEKGSALFEEIVDMKIFFPEDPKKNLQYTRIYTSRYVKQGLLIKDNDIYMSKTYFFIKILEPLFFRYLKLGIEKPELFKKSLLKELLDFTEKRFFKALSLAQERIEGENILNQKDLPENNQHYI